LFARKWLTAGQMALLWGLVLIRLAMPVGPESSVSLQNLIQAIGQRIPTAESPVEPWRPVIHESPAAAHLSATDLKTPDFNPISESESNSVTTLLPMFTRSLSSILLFLPLIWLTGALCLLLYTVISHWRFTGKINRITASAEERLLQLWFSCCQSVSFHRKVPVVVFDEISQPAVIGLIRPRLLLPVDVTELDENQIKLIMLHELAHLKRRDLWVNWCLFGLRLLHWWNPTYWLAASRYYSLREQSRDAMVLRWMKQQHQNQSQTDCSREYSELLLTLAQRPDAGSRWRISLPVSMLGFLKNPLRKRSLANRLKALRSATVKTHPVQKATILAVIILVAASGLTDADYPPVEKAFDENWLSQLDVDYYSHPSPAGPLILQVFDLTRPLNKIREVSQITADQARRNILLLVQSQLSMQPEPHPIIDRPVAKYQGQNYLIVRAPESMQDEIRTLSEAWAQSGMGPVKLTGIELTSLTDVVDQSVFADLSQDPVPVTLKQRLKLPDESTQTRAEKEQSPLRIAVLTAQQKRELIQKVQNQPNHRETYGPHLKLFNGQKIMQSLVYQPLTLRPYVVRVLEGNPTQSKLKTMLFEEGIRIFLRPTITADQSALHLHTIVQQSEITSEKTFKTHIAGKSVSVKSPDVTTKRCQANVKLKNGYSLLILIPPATKSKFYHYLLLETEVIEKTDAP
ncbi:MAG: hypothetical protein CME31_11145, partial [Gimesia sp.]|nr:hypothetical protein [Gimesia sp.]